MTESTTQQVRLMETEAAELSTRQKTRDGMMKARAAITRTGMLEFSPGSFRFEEEHY